MDPLTNWAQGIRLLVGIVVATITIAILVVGGWVGLRSLHLWLQQRRSLKYDDQGASQTFSHLDGNRRLCDECHRVTASSLLREESDETLPPRQRGLHAGGQAGRKPEEFTAC